MSGRIQSNLVFTERAIRRDFEFGAHSQTGIAAPSAFGLIVGFCIRFHERDVRRFNTGAVEKNFFGIFQMRAVKRDFNRRAALSAARREVLDVILAGLRGGGDKKERRK